MPNLSPVSYMELVSVLEVEGFRCVRIEGSHMVFTKPGIMRPTVIPRYMSVPVFIIKNNFRTDGISPKPLLPASLGQKG